MFRPADALASAGPPIIYESALRASVNAPARPRLVAQCKRNNRIGRQDQAASRFVLPHQRKNLAKSGRFKRSGPPIYMRANYASTLTRDVHSAFAARCAITGARLLRAAAGTDYRPSPGAAGNSSANYTRRDADGGASKWQPG